MYSDFIKTVGYYTCKRDFSCIMISKTTIPELPRMTRNELSPRKRLDTEFLNVRDVAFQILKTRSFLCGVLLHLNMPNYWPGDCTQPDTE